MNSNILSPKFRDPKNKKADAEESSTGSLIKFERSPPELDCFISSIKHFKTAEYRNQIGYAQALGEQKAIRDLEKRQARKPLGSCPTSD